MEWTPVVTLASCQWVPATCSHLCPAGSAAAPSYEEEEELTADPSEETLIIEARFQPLRPETMTKSKDGFLGVSGAGRGGIPAHVHSHRALLSALWAAFCMPHYHSRPCLRLWVSGMLFLLPGPAVWRGSRR